MTIEAKGTLRQNFHSVLLSACTLMLGYIVSNISTLNKWKAGLEEHVRNEDDEIRSVQVKQDADELRGNALDIRIYHLEFYHDNENKKP